VYTLTTPGHKHQPRSLPQVSPRIANSDLPRSPPISSPPPSPDTVSQGIRTAQSPVSCHFNLSFSFTFSSSPVGVRFFFYRRRSLGDSPQRPAALLLRIPCHLRLSLISTGRAHRVVTDLSSAASFDGVEIIRIPALCLVFERAARLKGEFD